MKYCPICTCEQTGKKGMIVRGHFVLEYNFSEKCVYCGGKYREVTTERITQCHNKIIKTGDKICQQ